MRGAIVLAGGPSRRLGEPKAFADVAGSPLLARVVEAVERVAEEIVVVTRRPMAARAERLLGGRVRYARDPSRIRSPIVGLVAGSTALRARFVAALPCDLPFLEPRLLRRLFVLAKGHDAAIPRWPNGMIEPLVAVYRRAALRRASIDTLAAGGRSNQDMIDRLSDVRFVEVDRLRPYDVQRRSFVNVNTPEDLARARRLATRPAARPRTR